MGKYFGTDGFRGEANIALTADHAFSIGKFLGWHYGARLGRRARVVIGKDTRLSSYMFEYAIAAGLTSAGADAYMLHVITTPGVAYAARVDGFDCGIMISASHNAYTDNGIKLIGPGGEKLDDGTITGIEAYLDGAHPACAAPAASGSDIGRIHDHIAGRNRYVGYLISLAAHSYRGMRIGLDCANGSAWNIARTVFEALGAEVHVINARPDGANINRDAGSTHISPLRSLVLEKRLDAGFAYDGDADRCIAVDENGGIVDGDLILYILARRLKREGKLEKDTIAATVMSNLGLHRALEKEGIAIEQTAVGDRHVCEAMVRGGYSLGGEQSGHIIIGKYASTGDGILTSIALMEAIAASKQSLSRLGAGMEVYPQVLKNVPVADKAAVMANAAVQEAAARAREQLGAGGRILVRESGTEQLIRVMAEAEELSRAEACVEDIVSAMRGEGLA